MYMYRISKYDPKYRKNGIYMIDEWTDYSDIGKVFENKILTEQEYCLMEQNYVLCIIDILRLAKIESLYIEDLETYETTIWINKQCILNEDWSALLRDCLRNKCWCRLENNGVYIHFGYDYYVYMGINLPCEKIKQICQNYGLFCSVQRSPYHVKR